MRKFLKINDAAATAGVKNTLFAVDDMLSVADGTGALDFKFKHPQGGAAGVTSFSLGLVAGETAEGAINSILEEFAVGKELVVDAMALPFFYGEESAVAYTAADVAVGAAITFTVANGVTGMTVEATLTDSAGVSLTSTSTLTGATAPALSFDDTGGDLTAGAGAELVAKIKYPGGRLAKTQTLAVTLT